MQQQEATHETYEARVERLRDIIEDGAPEAIREVCEELHPATVADLLHELSPDRILTVLNMLDEDQRVETFGHLPLETQRDLTAFLEPRELASLIVRMPHDERVDLLQRLTPEHTAGLLRMVAKTERDDMLRLATYPEGTAGAIMTSDYALLDQGLTAGQAIAQLRQAAPEKETIYTAYVVDKNRRLVGYVRLRDLILAEPGTPLGDLVEHDAPYVRVTDDQREAARILSKYDMLAVPVVNGGDALVGIITFDDAMDVSEREATEDMHRMGAAGLVETSLKDATVGLLVRKRVPWLMILVFMNIFSGAGIAFFEDTIEAVVALVFFLPLLIDSGGNAGSQASTLMVRSLATGDVRLRDWFGLLRKEVIVAVAMGILMGIAVSPVGIFRAGPEVAVVVALTMVCVVVAGSLIGMLLPFLLQRFRFDPATASAPLVTSLADIAGVLIYFSIATWYLGIHAAPAA